MKKIALSTMLLVVFATSAVPASTGVTNGGKPFLPSNEIALGGVTNGGRPFVTTTLYAATGVGMEPTPLPLGDTSGDMTSVISPRPWFGIDWFFGIFDFLGFFADLFYY